MNKIDVTKKKLCKMAEDFNWKINGFLTEGAIGGIALILANFLTGGNLIVGKLIQDEIISPMSYIIPAIIIYIILEIYYLLLMEKEEKLKSFILVNIVMFFLTISITPLMMFTILIVSVFIELIILNYRQLFTLSVIVAIFIGMKMSLYKFGRWLHNWK